jgi:hypothetical protein
VSDTELYVEPEIRFQYQEAVTHYVCCQLPEHFAGATKTFCGLTIFAEQSTKHKSICPQCREVATRNGCPIGIDCEAVE